MKATIYSVFMDNIPWQVLDAQKRVMDKMTDIEFVQYRTDRSHAETLDFIAENSDDDVMIFMDIDCIPLNDDIIGQAVQLASQGYLFGNAQSSSHIDGGKHAFVAPSFMALSKKTYNELGCPSFRPTARGDVGEELTWVAEAVGVSRIMLMPVHFESSPTPVDMGGVVSNPICWNVEGHLFGLNTTFVFQGRLATFHSFQSSLAQTERFIRKCDEVCRGIIKFG